MHSLSLEEGKRFFLLALYPLYGYAAVGAPIVKKNHWATTLVSDPEDTNKLNSIVLAVVYYHADATAF